MMMTVVVYCHRVGADDVCGLVVCRYTEIPNRYPIFSNTDTDTDVGILNTENTENSVRYSPSGAVRCVTFETGQLRQSYWPLMFSDNQNNIGY